LAGLQRLLGDIEGLEFVHLDTSDVVRHRIVGDIVAAYEKDSAQKELRKNAQVKTSHD
jgi:phosphate starvation-inducible PhoH-like protein